MDAGGKTPPDSSRALILSERVGAIISTSNAEKFHLFGQAGSFNHAVVLVLPDSSCAVRFTFPGGEHDTVVRYSWQVVTMMAERIEHFEELENGEYIMGSIPVHLRYASPGLAGSAEFVPPGQGQLVPAVLSWKSHGALAADSSVVRRYARATRDPDVPLPLATVPGLRMPRHYPALAFAVGCRTLSPNLSGLNAGTIGLPSSSFWILPNLASELLVTEEIGIQVDWAFNLSDCRLSGATLVIYTHAIDDPQVRLFLEAGVVWTHIHSSLSDRGGFGPAPYFQASAGGGRAGFGFEIVEGNSISIVADASYEFIARDSDVYGEYYWSGIGPAPTWPVSVNLSSFRFDIRVKIQ